MSLQDNLNAIENLIRRSAADLSISLASAEERLRERIATAEKKLNSSIGCEDESEDEDD